MSRLHPCVRQNASLVRDEAKPKQGEGKTPKIIAHEVHKFDRREEERGLPVDPPSLKRKRLGTQSLGGPTEDAEGTILRLIKSRGDLGMLLKEIKYESKVPDKKCTQSLKALMGKSLIKEVTTIKYKKGMKVYMAAEFEPSKELSGGDWYENGELDKVFIQTLSDVCEELIKRHGVLTLDMAYLIVKEREVVTFEITKQQIGEILTLLVLDNKMLEVKSTGLGDYSSIPRGTTCYRGGAKGPKMGGFASIPCGACPRIGDCSSDGTISPSTCVYLTKWLDIEF